MVILENDKIRVSADSMGAELHNIYNKETNLEYLWNGDATFWPRHSPVLFPVVGGLIDDTFVYRDTKYELIKHGFARDTNFEVESTSSEKVSFVLKSDNETIKSYPFNFLLRISYELIGNTVQVTYEVENAGAETMYFSIGTHPAFNVPLVDGTSYEDYYLEFEQEEDSERHNLNGNILTDRVPYLQKQTKLGLKSSLFYNDAIIFKDLKSSSITIKSDKTPHGLTYNFEGFPYMGIWAATDAPFVCIEPWCGIPDVESHNQKIEDKEGIISLNPGGVWKKSVSITSF